MLLNFAIYNPLDDPNTPNKISACTIGDAEDKTNALFVSQNNTLASPETKRDSVTDSTACRYDMKAAKASNQSLSTSWSGTAGKAAADVGVALEKMQQYFQQEDDTKACDDPRIMFTYSNGAIVGVHMGPAFDKTTVVSTLEQLAAQFKQGQASETVIAQLCGATAGNTTRNAHHVFGVAVNAGGNLAAVQKAVRSWSSAQCVSSDGNSAASQRTLEGVRIIEDASDLTPQTFANRTLTARLRGKLMARGDCKTLEVVGGDSCGTLASKCGISASDFTKYNPDKTLCSTLQEGQRVCCSSGTLPDIKPKPQADGTCATYLVVEQDNCSKLAAKNGLTLLLIERFNNGTTWGWNGMSFISALMASPH